MLSLIEKIIFIVAAAASAILTLRGLILIFKHISAGKGKVDWSLIPRRIRDLVVKVGLFGSVLRFRLIPSIFHIFIAWSFLILALNDLADPIYALTGFRLFDNLGTTGHVYQLLADIANAAVLVGILFMVVRRFVFRPANLWTRDTTLLDPRARSGIKRDSVFVASFIIICNTARLFMTAFHLAGAAGPNPWEPIASSVAGLFSGMSPGGDHGGRACRFLDLLRRHPALPALFPLLQAHPHVLCPAQLRAQA